MANLYDSATGPGNIDNILTTTLKAQLAATPADNFYDDYVGIDWLNRNGRIEKKGGERISAMLEYADQGESEFLRGYDPINTTGNEFLTEAMFEWCEQATSIKISNREIKQNSGKHKLVDLLEAKKKNALKSMKKLQNTALFNAAPGAKDPWSLPEIISSSDPTRANLGGIDRDTYPWWKANLTGSVGSFAFNGLTNMRTMYSTVSSSLGKNTSKLILTTATIFDYYEKALQPQARYQDKKSADAGWESLRFRNAAVVWDEGCNSGYMYFLNPEAFKIVVEASTDFELMPFVKPANGIYRIAQIVSMYNVVATEPRRLGLLTGITA